YSIGTVGPDMKGFAAGGGAYFEARLKFAPQTQGNGGWPSFWTMSAEHLFGSATHFLEIDFEYFGTIFGGNDLSGFTAHDWNGSSNTQDPHWVTGQNDDSQWHVYGWLWKPGNSITYYLDGKQVGSTTIQSGGLYSAGDSQHLPVILGTATGWPMQVDWVHVWQPQSAATADGHSAAGGSCTASSSSSGS